MHVVVAGLVVGVEIRSRRDCSSDETTPYEKLKSLDGAERFLKPGVSFDELDAFALSVSDLDAADAVKRRPRRAVPRHRPRRGRSRVSARRLRRTRGWTPVPCAARVSHRLPTAALLSEGIAPVTARGKRYPAHQALVPPAKPGDAGRLPAPTVQFHYRSFLDNVPDPTRLGLGQRPFRLIFVWD